MAIIPGVTVDWRLSPRVVTLPATVTDITVEDYQDTLLDLEAQETDGILFPHLRNTSGGESLGGGVTVGWTMELQNAVTAFAPRTVSVSNGTATTSNPAGTKLIDSTATFITDGVLPGATIINFTDQSVTSVISIDSETQLTHYALDDGTDNDWDTSDVYKVWNEIQTEITGGNVVAVDGVGSPISPIRPTFGTQVLKTSSSSATLQELESIQFASFGGGVSIDATSSNSGTAFPNGNLANPVNNLVDAKAIAVSRGLTTLFFIGNFTLLATDNVDNFKIVGEGHDKTITFTAGVSTISTEIVNAMLMGSLSGETFIRDCHIMNLAGVEGHILDSMFGGILTLSGVGTVFLINCHSAVPGALTPEVNMGGSGSGLGVRNYNGGIKISNRTGIDNVSIDMNSGHIILDSTVIAGTLVLRGISKLTDNSGSGATINTDDLIQPFMIGDLHDEAFGKWVVDPTAKTLKLFKKDNTLLKQFNLGDTAVTIPDFVSRTPV